MRNRKRTPEQIIRKLAEGEKLLGEGRSIDEVSRHLDIPESNLTSVAEPVRCADNATRLSALALDPQQVRRRRGLAARSSGRRTR
jgi:hypothetical protein